MPSDNPARFDRRSYLKSLAAVAGTASLSGCFLFDHGDEDAATTMLADDRARELAERLAPQLYFDEHEQWFPTDPRPFETEREGETVVDGFDAFDGYTDRYETTAEPPDPLLFYQAVRYVDSPLAVVQYWSYSVFDQFTTNFHWHDWEVLHAFVDLDTGEPQLFVASSHSGRVPNNEFLDPKHNQAPRILSELGSHSSALSLNETADSFQRLPSDGTFADITNSAIDSIADIADIPVAYGLPRDEGFPLPYVVPELDGSPLYDHDRLPSVSQADLVADELTIGSFGELLSPPENLPERGTGMIFQYAGREGTADVEYELLPTSEVEHISDFTGPQLSFEFSIPAFAEDAIANHITSTGVPWDQPRYEDPAADISGSVHRGALAERYDAIGEPGSINCVVARITEAVSSEDAPENEGLTTEAPSVESVALLESNPEAVPSFRGVVVIQDVPEGEHQLTVNGPGVAPHSETVAVETTDAGPSTAGIGGEVPLVARKNAMKLEVDADGTDADLTDLAVEDDFAGRLYDAPLVGPDAVYVHRGGAYTIEVRDADDEIGAFRVNPGRREGQTRLEAPNTGKASLSKYLADLADETASSVVAVATEYDTSEELVEMSISGGQQNDLQRLVTTLEAVADTAHRAAARAQAGERGRADESLETVRNRLERVKTQLSEAADELPDDLKRAVGHRLEQSERRSEQALAAEKL